jgi:D-amino peptidase
MAVCGAMPGHAADRKVFIMTDLEGASGVYRFAQTREPDPLLGERAKEYLMEDIRHVVRGLRAGGATEILVVDGHGSGAFVPHLMEPGAKYMVGRPLPGRGFGLDATYVGLVQVGAHAMMGTSDGVLHHTQSSRTENRYWYNGVETGEIAQCAAIAGHFGVPPILVTGDTAVCREAATFFGPECVTVAVKEGLGREAAILYPFAETHQALFEGARRAMAAIDKCKPYRLTVPIQAKKQFLQFESGSDIGKLTVKEGTIAEVLDLFSF